MPHSFEHYNSIFFVLGLLVVAAYGCQRFNEPSFPNKDTLPHTVDPLRYLFLKRSYRKAIFAYIAASLLLYSALVLPGPSIVPMLFANEKFPPECWALLVALFLVGVVPNSRLPWLIVIEERLRRLVHAWFLVPGGTVRTTGFLEDARFDPPASQLELLPNAVKDKLRNDLKLPTGSLQYRWARATMLIMSLRQMGSGADHPLRKAAFEPFDEDFKAIVTKHRSLAQDIEALKGNSDNRETEENLTESVNDLLRRIYLYISWGIRYQADNEAAVYQTLEDLGFRVPPTGGRNLFNIIGPAVLFIAAVTMIFWLTVDALSWRMGWDGAITVHESVVAAIISAVAAGVMYGYSISIALNRRSAQIERKIWRHASPKCLVSIAVRAGLITWAVIVITTMLGRLPDTLLSLVALAHEVMWLANSETTMKLDSEAWKFLPVKMATALPWLLVGATVSAVIAIAVGGDVRRTGKSQRLRDAALLGGALFFVAALAQLTQISLSAVLEGEETSLAYVPMVGLVGLACGAAIGVMVPGAYRLNVVTPLEPVMVRVLQDLRFRAEIRLGTKVAAEDWLYTPHYELGGITPAEAIQYKTHATGVGRLLENSPDRICEEFRPGDILHSGASRNRGDQNVDYKAA